MKGVNLEARELRLKNIEQAVKMQLEGCSTKEIGAHFGVTRQAVGQWLKSARESSQDDIMTDADFERRPDEHIKEPHEYRKPSKWALQQQDDDISTPIEYPECEYTIDPPEPMSEFDRGYLIGYFEGVEIGRTMSISHPIHQNRVEAMRYLEMTEKHETSLNVPVQSGWEVEGEEWRQRPATESQKQFCRNLLDKAGVKYQEAGIAGLTMGDADKVIKTYKK